jgi:hypothetical protein
VQRVFEMRSTLSPNLPTKARPMKIEEGGELPDLIAAIRRLVRRMGCRFVVDPAKVRNWPKK